MPSVIPRPWQSQAIPIVQSTSLPSNQCRPLVIKSGQRPAVSLVKGFGLGKQSRARAKVYGYLPHNLSSNFGAASLAKLLSSQEASCSEWFMLHLCLSHSYGCVEPTHDLVLAALSLRPARCMECWVSASRSRGCQRLSDRIWIDCIHASAFACACSLPGPPFQLSLLHPYWGLPTSFNGKICYFKLVVKRASSGTCRTLRHTEIINSLLWILP